MLVFRMDVFINDDSVKGVFPSEIGTHLDYEDCELEDTYYIGLVKYQRKLEYVR